MFEKDGISEYIKHHFKEMAASYERELRASAPKGSVIENAEIVRFHF